MVSSPLCSASGHCFRPRPCSRAWLVRILLLVLFSPGGGLDLSRPALLSLLAPRGRSKASSFDTLCSISLFSVSETWFSWSSSMLAKARSMFRDRKTT